MHIKSIFSVCKALNVQKQNILLNNVFDYATQRGKL
jgi:esterase/lipase